MLTLSSVAFAKQQSVYSPDNSIGYFVTSENDLYSLNITATVSQSADELKQKFKQLNSPPADASLVVDNSLALYAVTGSGCGSTVDIYKYDQAGNSWASMSSSSDNWYQENATVWYDQSTDAILVYGGQCDNKVSSSFYSFTINNSTWAPVVANPMPREVAYAQAIRISNESTVIVGGQANTGWLSMQQVAFWEYGSWTYRSISNYTGVDSRNSPVLYPLWDNSKVSLTGVLAIGGTVDGRAANPNALILNFNESKGLYWSQPDIPVSDLMATAYTSIYASNKLYNSNGNVADKVSAPVKTPTDSDTDKEKDHSLSVGSIAALSTIIPLIAIIACGVGAFLWWRKRKQRAVFQPRHSVMSPDMRSVASNFPDFLLPGVPGAGERSNLAPPAPARVDDGDSSFEYEPRHSKLRVVNPDDISQTDASRRTSFGNDSLDHSTLHSSSSRELLKDSHSDSSDSESLAGTLSLTHSRSSSRASSGTYPVPRGKSLRNGHIDEDFDFS